MKRLYKWLVDKKRLGRLAENIIAGVLLALLFFLLSDVWFGVPGLDGKWKFHTKVTESKAFEGDEFDFIGLLQQTGQEIHGSAEKVGDNIHGVKTKFDISKRVQLNLSGYITKRYFGKDTLVLHLSESGRLYNIETIQILTIENGDSLAGRFKTTRGEHKGEVIWEKEQ